MERKPISCDVLVIGEGIAGFAAALSAAARGIRVVVIEKAPEDIPHGNTAFSGGSFRRAAPEYPAEKFFQDITTLSGGRADSELTRIVAERSADARDWLTRLGVQWTHKSRDPAAADQVDGQGMALAATIRRAVRQNQIQTYHQTEAIRLVKSDQSVVGISAQDQEGQFQIPCHAVVLATGGFQANPEMVVRYLGEGGKHLVLRGSPYNTGDGIRMAQQSGALIDWMDDFHGGLIHYGYKNILR